MSRSVRPTATFVVFDLGRSDETRPPPKQRETTLAREKDRQTVMSPTGRRTEQWIGT
jgi:hypothetical protein